ncbi:hypothetical protein [Nocardioides sp.]|uniref:hypothetical protein n=1 Tax=Nocardioides sp. TaxID=35761 RepID=UPI00356A516D
MSLLDSARTAGSSAGDLLLTVSQSVGLQPVPWLPPGEVLPGRVFRHGLADATGVAWWDEAGSDDVWVRLAYGIALTGGAPTVVSLGIRILGEEPTDLLLTHPTRRPTPDAMLVSVAPYLAPDGEIVVLGARATGSETFELSCSRGDDAAWQPFADLRVSPVPLVEENLVLDPSHHPLPGLVHGLAQPSSGDDRR